MNNFNYFKQLVFISIIVSLNGFAQNDSDDQVLPEVEVVGTSPLPGIGIEKNKLPSEIYSISDEELYRTKSLNLPEFIANEIPGVNINEVQGSPYQADITYRGFRASGILGSPQGLSIFMDGVRMNEPFGDVVNWDMLPEFAFSNVSLISGSNPIYGLNTLGGALAFTTKSGLTDPGSDIKYTIGSYGRSKADISFGHKSKDGWHRFVSGTHFNEDGWRDFSQGKLSNIFFKLGKVDTDFRWNVSLLSGYSNLLGNGLLPSFGYGTSGNGSETAGMYENNRRAVYTHPDITQNQLTMVILNFQKIINNNSELAFNFYVKDSSRLSNGGDAEIEEEDDGSSEFEAVINTNITKQKSNGASVNLTKIINEHQLTLGASLDSTEIDYGASETEDCELDAFRGVTNCESEPESTAAVSGSSFAFGLYASDTMKYTEKTFFTVAARYNHSNVSNTITNFDDGVGSEQPKESFNYNSLNPSVGFSSNITNNLNFFGNISQSNRVPTVIELGCADKDNPCRLPTGLQADPYLEQVKAQTIETGIRVKLSKNTSIVSTVYRTQNKNDILFRALSNTGQGFFSNFDKTLREGLDFSAKSSYKNFVNSFNYSYLKATYQSSGELFGGDRNIDIIPGTKIAGLPEHTVKLKSIWIPNEKLNIGGTLITTSSIVTQGNEDGKIGLDDDTYNVDTKIDGYSILNLFLNYKPKKKLDYFIRISNVFDTRFKTYGLMATSLFNSSGNLLSTDPTVNVFAAPGMPRLITLGFRYKY